MVLLLEKYSFSFGTARLPHISIFFNTYLKFASNTCKRIILLHPIHQDLLMENLALNNNKNANH